MPGTDYDLCVISGGALAGHKLPGVPLLLRRHRSCPDRAGDTGGLAKLVTALNGRLLGAAILGPNAGELIHELVLAMAHGMKVADIPRAIHVYPTLAQICRRVAVIRP